MNKELHGVKDGRLAACPDSPNCVSTLAQNPEKRMDPLPFYKDTYTTKELLKSILHSMDRASIEMETSNYLHCLFTTRIFRLKDDVEFLIDEKNKLVHFRSASRKAYSDQGVNRKRMTEIAAIYVQRTLDGPGL
ncbi:DUF1499 domain-containing protein [Halobacillus salinarum]|uniref:DUF1499 domain-containing protein n=1 Tax=Halobacillus salinarum TaxID=2932257 RepID=A0ABY4EGL7_9BACI|nr:DUF1499 domain-containing protein [Halobacillus salinarum]UOQ43590.1 DUF1499 domain-containing protein [Halobacillus salinarum]